MRTSTSWTTSIAALTVLSALVTGCSAAGSEPAAEPRAASHTMPDGSVMHGKHHGEPGQHGQHSQQARHASQADPEPEPAGPSPAARMVCTGDVVDDVTRILAIPEEPDVSSTWDAPIYECTYKLEDGPLVLSVHDATDPRTGRKHFEALRAELGQTRPLQGIYGLGLPAFETDDGTVVFIKDGKTLRVAATALPGQLGPDDNFTQTEIAYAVATSVLACWTAHA